MDITALVPDIVETEEDKIKRCNKVKYLESLGVYFSLYIENFKFPVHPDGIHTYLKDSHEAKELVKAGKINEDFKLILGDEIYLIDDIEDYKELLECFNVIELIDSDAFYKAISSGSPFNKQRDTRKLLDVLNNLKAYESEEKIFNILEVEYNSFK